jgi:acetaldehyde dehydrogenase / alcohol dehydrogenase
MPAPGYTSYVAPDKYAQMAWVHGLGGRSAEDRRARLFAAVDEVLDTVGVPRGLADAGVSEAEFEAALPELAEAAFVDASLRTNPRMPMVVELVDLLRAGFAGRDGVRS